MGDVGGVGRSGSLRVSGLFIHPVKGVRAVPVERLELDEIGPVGDRRWMVASPSGDRFLTQRSHPAMALVEASLGPEGTLTLRAPGAGAVRVGEPGPGAERLAVPIWDDRTEGRVASDEAARWLTEFLGDPAVLVRIPDDTVRAVAPEHAREGFQGRVAFADDEPVHLLTEASVRDLDGRLPADAPTMTVERFRPNVVIEGAEPWAEDRWRRVRIGGVMLALVRPRARCVVTTVDPATGETGPEPLATLARFRRHEGSVYVGQNALHDAPGALAVGDEVVVVETGPPRPDIDVSETIGDGPR